MAVQAWTALSILHGPLEVACNAKSWTGPAVTVAELDTTAFGSTWTTKIGGLKSGSITIEFMQDFVDNGIDEVVFAALGSTLAVTVQHITGTIAAALPQYQGTALVTSWSPMNATVGDLATVSVTWPITGAVVRDITP